MSKDSVRKGKKNEATAVQRFLPIAEIRQDTVILKNGGIRAVLSVTSMNFSLKSDEEQQAIINSYQQFVNSITFPVQIVVRSTKLNVDSYIADLERRAGEQKNPLLKEQTLDYAHFIDRLIDVSDIMQKRFFVIVPMDPPGALKVSFFQKYLNWLSPGDTRDKALTRRRQFDELSATLRDRVTIVQAGLSSVGLVSDRLTTSELIELYYEIYNPNTSREQKLQSLGEMGVKEYVL
jgi:type IV secretory pathway VirB4 component